VRRRVKFGECDCPGDIPAAFAAYEAIRRPASQTFQEAAGKSLDWYENVASKMDLDPITFAYDYMRRTDQVSHEDLKLRFTAAYEALCRAQPPVASKRATALQLQGG
jgi:hypothetical protein